MPEIKIRKKQENRTPIKKLNRKLIYSQKLKNNIISIKEKTNYITENEDNSPNEYGINRIKEETRKVADKGINNFKQYGKKSAQITKRNIQKANQKIKQKIEKKEIKTTKSTIKNTNKTIKTIKRTERVTYKTTKQTAKATVKGAKKAYQIAKVTAKSIMQGVKAGIKITVSTVKAIILSTKALITALIAGGWIAVIIIVVMCLVAMLCSSVYGIFFSSENKTDGKNMSSVISEINNEFITKITDIQKNTKHDEYDISANRAEWKDILAVYSAKVSKGEDDVELMTLSNERVQTLKEVFWDMNSISSMTEKVTKQITTTNSKTENKEQTILHITITNKSVEEMTQMYNFNEKQKRQLSELLKEEFEKMWLGAIYGSSNGSNDIVAVAKQQIGNSGGQTYWSWYGFSSRVEWCACFVSWCANQCGYIDAGVIPKFASVGQEGIPWFKTCGLWRERGFIPNPGDIVFFDWENDGTADHVGIVEKVENNEVYTIEGNSNDLCRQKQYDINSRLIFGYGTPRY